MVSKTDYSLGFLSALMFHVIAFFLLGMSPSFSQDDRVAVQPHSDSMTLSLVEEMISDNLSKHEADTPPRPQPDKQMALLRAPQPLPEHPLFKELSSDIIAIPKHPLSELVPPSPTIKIQAPSPLPDKIVLTKLTTILANQELTDPNSLHTDSQGSLQQGALIAPTPKGQSINPKYPMTARRRGEQGRVILDVLVSKEGKAASITLVSSSGFTDLDTAAKEAVIQAIFKPGERNGKPVAASARMTILFQLNPN